MSTAMTSRRLRSRARVGGVLAALAAGVAGSLVIAPAAHAAPPTIDALTLTTPDSVDAGDPVVVEIDVASAADLYAYELTVVFDDEELDFTSAVFPEGGFGAVGEAVDGELTVSYTRLGTSPGLTAGDLELAALTFTALEGGEATIAVTAATFVSSTTEALVASGGELPAPATTVVVAAPTPEPEPSEPAEPTTPSPAPGATGAPADSGSDADSGDVEVEVDPTTGEPLANTGVDAGSWAFTGALGAALLALGIVLALRRKAVTR